MLTIKCKCDKEFADLYEFYESDPQGLKLLELEGISPDQLDIFTMSDRFLETENVADASIDTNANANEGKTIANHKNEIVKGQEKLLGYYYLWQEMKELFGEARASHNLSKIWNGDHYFHDPTFILAPYCFAIASTNVMLEGIPYGPLKSDVPQRAESFIRLMTEVVIKLSAEIAGAVAVGDLITNYAWYAKKEKLTKYEIENDFQHFIFTVNQQLRSGTQSPFSNVPLFSRDNLETVFKGHVYPDGSTPDFDYIMKLQKIFGEFFAKGHKNLPYRFPVTTFNIGITDEKQIIDQEFLKWVSRVNREKYSFNIYACQGTKISSCCRLVNDFSMLNGADNFGNGGISIGSIRVITTNYARLGAMSKNKEELFKNLEERLEEAKEMLLAHRSLIKKLAKKKLYTFMNIHWMDIDHHLFSTFGLNGDYECLVNMGYDITDQAEGEKFNGEILQFVANKSKEYYEKYNVPFNVEQVPAESVAVKLAKKDSLLGFNPHEFEIYANQFVPLTVPVDLYERIELDGKYTELLSGGGISHINISEPIPSDAMMEKIIKFAVSKGNSHFALNPCQGLCKNGHVELVGSEDASCPQCGAEIIEKYTRIIGYITPISSWNKTRREYEFPRRKFLRFDPDKKVD